MVTLSTKRSKICREAVDLYFEERDSEYHPRIPSRGDALPRAEAARYPYSLTNLLTGSNQTIREWTMKLKVVIHEAEEGGY
ncbi:MAG: hypothetical protein ABIR84_00165, partial [Candidatus Nitrotoga sp.]